MSGKTRGGRPTGHPPARSAAVAVPALYRHSLTLVALFATAVVVAFWPTYFSRLGGQATYHPHAHGLTMAAWCALLVSQAWLVRTGHRAIHRRLGLVSYVLVPAMVIAAVNFLHFRVRGAQDLGPFGLYFVSLIVNALVAFVLLYGLAMFYRRQPAVHARFMVSTIFPLFTPVTDRLFGRFMPSIVPLVPRVDGSPVLPFAGFVLADVLLVALSVWDWSANRRLVFPVALGVVLLYHASVLTFYGLDFWRAFGAWFLTLPLS